MFVLDALPPAAEPLGERVLSHGEVANRLADRRPGYPLGQWLATLEFDELTEAELVQVAEAWERQERHLAARRNELYAALESRTAPAWDGLPPARSAEEWEQIAGRARVDAVSMRLGMAWQTAGERFEHATALASTGVLAQTGAALSRGEVSEASARLFVRCTSGVSADVARAVESALLPRAGRLTPGKLGRLLKREVARRRPDLDALENEEARARRCVTRPRPSDFGMATLQVEGPAEDIHSLWTAIDALGRATTFAAKESLRAAGLPSAAAEGIDAHRFDALINLAAGALAQGGLPERHGRRPSIQVTVALSTLLGLDDEPGDLDGHGALDAHTVRRIASDPTATWHRLVTDDLGRVLDYGTTRYRPPQDLTDLVIARDRTCIFPTCSVPARNCQIDHIVPFPTGPTSESNTGPECGRHHRAKTAKLTSVRYDPATGEAVWVDQFGVPAVRTPETVPTAPASDATLRQISAILRRGSEDMVLAADRARADIEARRTLEQGPQALPPRTSGQDDEAPPF